MWMRYPCKSSHSACVCSQLIVQGVQFVQARQTAELKEYEQGYMETLAKHHSHTERGTQKGTTDTNNV